MPRESNTFVSLFCGSCSVESKIVGFDKVILNDKHKYLIALLKGIQNGYELPDIITEEQYKYIRDNKDIDPVCGSGSTLRAAAELNRNAYGFEVSKEFYQKAKDIMLKDYIK